MAVVGAFLIGAATAGMFLGDENQRLKAHCDALQARLDKFAAFDGDGDGRPGGSRPRPF